MIKHLLLILASSLLFPAFGQSDQEYPDWLEQIANDSLTANVGLSKIKLGQTENEILAILGNPTYEPFKVTATNSNSLIYEFTGISLNIYTDLNNGTVKHIRISDKNFNKSGWSPKINGVTIGMKKKELVNKFGKPIEKRTHITCPCDNPNTTSYIYEGITFWVCSCNNKVYLIDIPF